MMASRPLAWSFQHLGRRSEFTIATLAALAMATALLQFGPPVILLGLGVLLLFISRSFLPGRLLAVGLVLIPLSASFPSLPIAWIYALTLSAAIAALAFTGRRHRLTAGLFLLIYGGHVCYMTAYTLDAGTPAGFQAHAIACLGLIAGLAGICMSSVIPRVTEISPGSLTINHSTWNLTIFLYSFGILALLATYWYMGTVPLLRNTLDGSDHSRISALRGTGFIRYFAHLSIVAPQTIATISAYFGDWRSFHRASALLLVTGVLHAGFGFRTPLLLAILVPLALWLAFGGRKGKVKRIFLAMNVVIALLYFFALYGSYRTGHSYQSAETMFTLSATNILGSDSAKNLYQISKVFPNEHPILWGSGYARNISMWANPLRSILGMPRVNEFGLWLKELTGVGEGGGGMSPTVAGEAFMNFSLIGVAGVLCLFGLIWHATIVRAWTRESGAPLLHRVISFHIALYLLGAVRTGLTTGLIGLLLALACSFLLVSRGQRGQLHGQQSLP